MFRRATRTGTPAWTAGRARFLVLSSFVSLLIPIAGGCATYRDALGYRARQATMARDLDAMKALMEEASTTEPTHALVHPRKTVLSHFLDFGGDERFMPTIEEWRERGWIDDAMTCAIYRARYRGVRTSSPEEADRAASVCIDRARGAAHLPDRGWELEACLDQAPFLTETSTVALSPYLSIAGDIIEPLSFRHALLEGMTHIFLQDALIRLANEPTLSEDEARQQARLQIEGTATRFRAILEAVQPGSDATLLASATAFGALELERGYQTMRKSFVADYASSADPALRALAWSWIRSMKASKRIPRLDSLGLWDRNREPATDTYWYLCSAAPAQRDGAVTVPVFTYRVGRRVDDVASLAADCAVALGTSRAQIAGPYPLNLTARFALSASLSAEHEVDRVQLVVKGERVWQ